LTDVNTGFCSIISLQNTIAGSTKFESVQESATPFVEFKGVYSWISSTTLFAINHDLTASSAAGLVAFRFCSASCTSGTVRTCRTLLDDGGAVVAVCGLWMTPALINGIPSSRGEMHSTSCG
jgi:hypothetical protein